MTKKLILVASFALLAFAHAKMIGGVAMVVEGKAITTEEIRTVQHQNRVSKAKAIDLLILDRLQKVAMQDISISEDTVDAKIAEIASRNSVSVTQMQQMLQRGGTSWSQYRSTIRNALKKEQFYKEKVIASIETPSDDELKIFYKNHKKAFSIPSSIHMVEYSTEDEDTIKHFLQTKSKKGLRVRTVTKKTKELNPSLLSMLLQTKNGGYTTPFNAGDRYIVFKVRSKSGKTHMPFKAAKPAVLRVWQQQQQNKALKDYFEKMKTNANIQTIR